MATSVSLVDGSTSAPSLSFASAPTTGLFRDSTTGAMVAQASELDIGQTAAGGNGLTISASATSATNVSIAATGSGPGGRGDLFIDPSLASAPSSLPFVAIGANTYPTYNGGLVVGPGVKTSSGASLQLIANGAGSGTVMAVLSGASDESLRIDAQGAGGQINLQTQTPAGGVTVGPVAAPALLVTTPASGAGIAITGAAAGVGGQIGVTSTNTNENLVVNALGAGSINLATASTGDVTIGGPASGPALRVTAAAAPATGIHIAGSGAGLGTIIAVNSTATNEALSIDAKGSGPITLAGTSTGGVILGKSAANGGAAVTANGGAPGSGAFIGVDSLVANEPLFIDAKGTGQVAIGNASSGGVALGPASVLQTATGPGGSAIRVASTASGVVISTLSSGGNKTLSIDAAGSANINLGSTSTGPISVQASVTPVSGGATPTMILTSAHVAVDVGVGAPSASLLRPIGSIYINTTGSSTTNRLFVSLSGGVWAGIITTV